jgi:hypothetical protein
MPPKRNLLIFTFQRGPGDVEELRIPIDEANDMKVLEAYPAGDSCCSQSGSNDFEMKEETVCQGRDLKPHGVPHNPQKTVIRHHTSG